MEENEIKVPITFRISNVDIEEISLLPHKIEILPPGKEGFIFETTVGLNIEPKEKSVSIGVWAKLFTDREKTNFLGELKVKTVFIVENLPSLMVDKVTAQIPGIIMVSFISISISTARGILAAYTNNTPLKGAILPVQDPTVFAKQLQEKLAGNPAMAKTE